jgi:hypothetical protein
MKSPYTHRKIIRNPQDFIDRRETLQWILNRLDNVIDEVDCISITGERKIGKSSLVHALTYNEIHAKYLSAPGEFIFIYFDLQRKALFPTPERFFAEAAKHINKSMGIYTGDDFPELGYREFDGFLQKIDLKDRKLILLFDEFENLCVSPFDIDFFNYLRSVVAQYKIGYITTSCEPLDSLCASRKIQSSPFFNYFTTYNLELFKPVETRMLFKWGEEKSGVNFTDREKQAIISVAGHHPFFLQVACNLVFIQKESGRFSKTKLEESFLREAEPHFRYFITKSSEHEKRAIYQIAMGNYAGLHSYEKESLMKRSLAAITNRKPALFSDGFKGFVIDYLDSERDKIAIADDPAETLDTAPKNMSMKEIEELIKKVAKTDSTILINGEEGVGKEYLARRICEMSMHKKPFVICDCTQLKEQLMGSELFGHAKGAFTDAKKDKAGLVEEAEGGTLFIDEIGELKLEVQSQLLRFLQDKSFKRVGDPAERKANVRIIVATNRNLGKMVNEKAFRKDLFDRIKVHVINIPPLRERKEDIPILGLTFLKKFLGSGYRNKKRITKKVFEEMKRYGWPGNVRELELSIKSAVEESKGRDLKYSDIVKNPG